MDKQYVVKHAKKSNEAFNKIKEKLNRQKLDLIKSYDEAEIFNLMDAIKSGDLLRNLQDALDTYVPINLVNNKNNQIKYGQKTKQAFVDDFRKPIDNSSKGKGFAEREKAEIIYNTIYKLSMAENFRNIEGFNKYANDDISSIEFFETFVDLNKKKLCPKEYIEKWYKFDPCIYINPEVEIKIKSLTYSLSDLNNKVLSGENEELKNKILKQNEMLEEQKHCIKKLKLEQGKEKSIFDHKISSLEGEKQNLQRQIDEKNLKIKDLKLRIEKLEEENDNKQISHRLAISEKDTKINEYIERLASYSAELQKFKEAAINYDNNSNKLLESSEYIEELLEEIKDYEMQLDNYKEQIKEYEEQIKNQEIQQEEYNEKINENAELKEKIFNLEKAFNRTIAFKAQDLETKLYSDRKYQQILLSLILSDTRGGNAIIKYLNLKDEIIKTQNFEGNNFLDKRNELADLQKSIEELTKEKETLKLEIRKNLNLLQTEKKIDISQTQNLYKYNKNFGFEPRLAFAKFEKNLADFYTNGDISKAQSYFRKVATGDNFVIVDNDKFLDAFNLEGYGIEICRVSAEPSWHSIDDWFGKFDENGNFKPAKTQISDYYSFVKNTPELPFGFIVIDNFNIIPPEIYLVPFIDEIVNNGYKNLIHHSLVNSGAEYAKIEKIPNLKFILIKSQNENFAFDIPQSLKKYELCEVK